MYMRWFSYEKEEATVRKTTANVFNKMSEHSSEVFVEMKPDVFKRTSDISDANQVLKPNVK